jgi:hypothetical protein
MMSTRKHPVHMPAVERHNEAVIIFLTVCSKDRKPIFAFSDAAHAIISAWREAKTWLVGRYVLMPDHIHLFCAPGVFGAEPLKEWVRYWKTIASKKWPTTQRAARLAARFLGHTAAATRELWGQMGICTEQSGSCSARNHIG